MSLQTSTPRSDRFVLLARRPSCPRCGDVLFVPENAEFVTGEDRIRHTWLCEGCDHAFRTCVNVQAQ